jgi:hypothetical protein
MMPIFIALTPLAGALRDVEWGWPGVTPAAILTDPTAGAP